jgi:hypothetical protein
VLGSGYGADFGSNILRQNGPVGLVLLLCGVLGIWFVLTRNYARVGLAGAVAVLVNMIALLQLFGVIQLLTGASTAYGFFYSFTFGPGWFLLLPGSFMLAHAGFFKVKPNK